MNGYIDSIYSARTNAMASFHGMHIKQPNDNIASANATVISGNPNQSTKGAIYILLIKHGMRLT
jgi:hypothetical protein